MSFLFYLWFVLTVLSTTCVFYFGAQMLYTALVLWRNDRWTRYSRFGVLGVVERFADNPQALTISFRSIKQKNFAAPTLGFYDPLSKKIVIDLRVVRSHEDLVAVLLHELCHANQDLHGRLALGSGGSYFLRPIEREARSYTKAWFRVALAIYRRSTKSK